MYLNSLFKFYLEFYSKSENVLNEDTNACLNKVNLSQLDDTQNLTCLSIWCRDQTILKMASG